MILLSNGKQLMIRDASADDAEAMFHLFHQVSKESINLPFGEGEFGKSIDDVRKHIADCLKKDNAIYVVAEVDHKIIGYLSFEGGWRPRSRHTGEFGIAIMKSFWSFGIGTKLIEHLIDWAKKSTIITKINLTVMCHNGSAIKLYGKLGFVIEGRVSRASYINDTYHDIFLMGLVLDNEVFL